MTDRGTYALLIPLEVGLRLRIGRLGVRALAPGCYVYVGSALGGLSSRLKHHLGSKNRLHWHIDYLLLEAKVTQVWYSLGPARLECTWNEALGSIPGANPSVPGFGASDCRCRSHLTRFQATPPLEIFSKKLRQIGLPQVLQVCHPTIGQPAISISGRGVDNASFIYDQQY